MHWALEQLDPRGRTGRSAYWLIGAMTAIVVLLLRLASAPQALLLAIAITSQIILLLVTIRRLRDAGRSPWIVLWFLFPMDITFSLATISIYSYQIHLIDIGAILRSLPILLGLILRSRVTCRARLVMLPAF